MAISQEELNQHFFKLKKLLTTSPTKKFYDPSTLMALIANPDISLAEEQKKHYAKLKEFLKHPEKEIRDMTLIAINYAVLYLEMHNAESVHLPYEYIMRLLNNLESVITNNYPIQEWGSDSRLRNPTFFLPFINILKILNKPITVQITLIDDKSEEVYQLLQELVNANVSLDLLLFGDRVLNGLDNLHKRNLDLSIKRLRIRNKLMSASPYEDLASRLQTFSNIESLLIENHHLNGDTRLHTPSLPKLLFALSSLKKLELIHTHLGEFLNNPDQNYAYDIFQGLPIRELTIVQDYFSDMQNPRFWQFISAVLANPFIEKLQLSSFEHPDPYGENTADKLGIIEAELEKNITLIDLNLGKTPLSKKMQKYLNENRELKKAREAVDALLKNENLEERRELSAQVCNKIKKAFSVIGERAPNEVFNELWMKVANNLHENLQLSEACGIWALVSPESVFYQQAQFNIFHSTFMQIRNEEAPIALSQVTNEPEIVSVPLNNAFITALAACVNKETHTLPAFIPENQVVFDTLMFETAMGKGFSAIKELSESDRLALLEYVVLATIKQDIDTQLAQPRGGFASFFSKSRENETELSQHLSASLPEIKSPQLSDETKNSLNALWQEVLPQLKKIQLKEDIKLIIDSLKTPQVSYRVQL